MSLNNSTEFYQVKLNNLGWTCPNCGKVFSPTITECLYCNADKSLITNTIKNAPFETTTSSINIKDYIKEDTIARYENK